MALTIAQINGRRGWKWGSTGTVYVGKNAKKRALQQGAAIKATEYKPEEPIKEQK